MPGTRYGTSYWLENVPKPRRPAWGRLRGELACDVVVVGGGLAGCVNAFVFAQSGARTVLLDSTRVAQGSTSGTPGTFEPGAGARFADLRDRHGLRAARQMWDAERRASLEAQALVRRLRLRCDLERLDTTDVAVLPSQMEALEREHRALSEAGFEASWLTGKRARAITGLEASAVLKRADAGSADLYRLAVGFAQHAEKRGATIFEQTTASRIKFGRKGVEVTTDGGLVRASTVVVATDLPQPDLRALHRHLKAVDTTVVLVPAVPAPIRATLGPSNGIVRDSGDSKHAWRVDKRGHLLLWQAGQPAVPARQRPATTVQRAAQLMYEFSVLYPAISGLQPSHGWMTSGHRSYDGLVIAGAHRSFPHHLFALGLGVDGLQGAFVAARLNLRHYQGAPEKGDELFGFVR